MDKNRGGRKYILTEKDKVKVKELLRYGLEIKTIANRFSVSVSVISRVANNRDSRAQEKA